MKQRQEWVVTADGRNARLFSCRSAPSGGLHLECVKSIKNAHEAEHERHRPSLLGGAERRGSVARSSAHAAPHAVAPKHTADEEIDRFAREVGEWLRASQAELGAGRMILFAPPRFLGLLRRHAAPEHAMEMHECDLAHLRTGELAVHPAVIAAVAGD